MSAQISSVQRVCHGVYRRTLSSDFVRKVVETWLTKIVLMAVGTITGVLVTRILGPDGRGLYAAATAVAAIGVQFGNLGLHASNSHYIARDRASLATLIGNSLIVSFGFGGFGVVVVWLLSLLRPNLLPVQGALLFLALLCVPFGLAYLLLQNLLLGMSQVRSYNTIEVVTKLAAFALILGIIGLQVVTAETLLVAALITSAIGFLWVMWALLKHTAGVPVGSLKIFGEHVRYGLRAYLVAFAGFIVLKIDILMVKSFLGAEQAGYYSVASSLADILYMLPATVGAILFPRLSAMTDAKGRWQLTRKAMAGLGAIMIPLAAAAALMSQTLVGLIYGSAFLPVTLPFVILCASMVLYGVNNVVSYYLASTGFPLPTVYAWILVSAMTICANWILIPRYGISGAAIGSLICYGSILVIQYGYAAWAVRTP